MTKQERIKRGLIVLSMERLARCINDEDVFMGWLYNGVADGDINKDTEPDDENIDFYCEDENYKDLLTLFTRLMYRAWRSGGLYDGKICGMDKAEWEEHING